MEIVHGGGGDISMLFLKIKLHFFSFLCLPFSTCSASSKSMNGSILDDAHPRVWAIQIAHAFNQSDSQVKNTEISPRCLFKILNKGTLTVDTNDGIC